MSGWSTGSAGRATAEAPLAGNAPTGDGVVIHVPLVYRNIIECMRAVHERQDDAGIALTAFFKYNAGGAVAVPLVASGRGFNWPHINGAVHSYPCPKLITQIQDCITDALVSHFGMFSTRAALLTAAIGASEFTALAAHKDIRAAIIETRKALELCGPKLMEDPFLKGYGDCCVRRNSEGGSDGQSYTNKTTKDLAWQDVFAQTRASSYTKGPGYHINTTQLYLWGDRSGWYRDGFYSDGGTDNHMILMRDQKLFLGPTVAIPGGTADLRGRISDGSYHPYDYYKIDAPSGVLFCRYAEPFHGNIVRAMNGDLSFYLRWGEGYGAMGAEEAWGYDGAVIAESAVDKTYPDPANAQPFVFANPFPDPVPADIFLMVDRDPYDVLIEQMEKMHPDSPFGETDVTDCVWNGEGGGPGPGYEMIDVTLQYDNSDYLRIYGYNKPTEFVYG